MISIQSLEQVAGSSAGPASRAEPWRPGLPAVAKCQVPAASGLRPGAEHCSRDFHEFCCSGADSDPISARGTWEVLDLGPLRQARLRLCLRYNGADAPLEQGRARPAWETPPSSAQL